MFFFVCVNSESVGCILHLLQHNIHSAASLRFDSCGCDDVACASWPIANITDDGIPSADHNIQMGTHSIIIRAHPSSHKSHPHCPNRLGTRQSIFCSINRMQASWTNKLNKHTNIFLQTAAPRCAQHHRFCYFFFLFCRIYRWLLISILFTYSMHGSRRTNPFAPMSIHICMQTISNYLFALR